MAQGGRATQKALATTDRRLKVVRARLESGLGSGSTTGDAATNSTFLAQDHPSLQHRTITSDAVIFAVF